MDNHEKITKILSLIRPNAEWTLRGDRLEDLEWIDEVQTLPTNDEFVAGEALMDSTSYRELRAPEYPPIGDGLDALVHKENGDPSVWEAYVAACNAVKLKYPKPE